MISILEMLVKFSLQFNFLDRRLKNAKSSVEISLVLFFQIFEFLLNIACASNFSAQRQQISQLFTFITAGKFVAHAPDFH